MLTATVPPPTNKPPTRRRPELPGYAELHCRSNFSFLTGASHPAELIARAQALHYAALAITDECSLAGVVRAHVATKELTGPFHLIIGSEMRLSWPLAEEGETDNRGDHHGNGKAGSADARLVLLAQNRRGYGNLSHWITVARRRAAKGKLPGTPRRCGGQGARRAHAGRSARVPGLARAGCVAVVR